MPRLKTEHPTGQSTNGTLRPREKLEIIIDTCSMGEKVMGGVSSLIYYAMRPSTNPVFDNYRVLIPIQLGTEKKQRLFPDFLDAELMTHRPEYLEKFYRTHRDNIRIVETDISLSYKLLFASKAVAYLRQHPELRDGLDEQAQKLAAKYDPVLGKQTGFTADALENFCQKIEQAYAKHAESFQQSRQDIIAYNRAYGVTRPELLEAVVRAAQQVALSRTAKSLFEQCSDAERYLLQTMYEHKEIYKNTANDKEFAIFRRDKGERAIESYLFGRNAESMPERVTLVVSEDMGARSSIHRLRTQSENSVFTVSSYGLALALKELKLISSLTHIVPHAVIEAFRAREEPKRAERLLGTSRSTMQDLLDPVIERKWAHRLVEVVNTGQWTAGDPEKEAPPPKRFRR